MQGAPSSPEGNLHENILIQKATCMKFSSRTQLAWRTSDPERHMYDVLFHKVTCIKSIRNSNLECNMHEDVSLQKATCSKNSDQEYKLQEDVL